MKSLLPALWFSLPTLSYIAAPNILSMEYSRIVAVTGMPGLYEILSSKSDGAIVRSLEDDSTRFVSSRVHNLSHLESIEIYTTSENVSLTEVFNAMKGSTDAQPDVKDNKALKTYFEKVYPEIDTERVYASDMKKMVNWFAVLQKHNIDYTTKEEAQPDEEPVVTEPAAEGPAETAAEAPAKKARVAKKEAVTEDISEANESPAEKKAPAKTRKKKSEE